MDGYFPGTVCDGKKIRLGKLAVCVELLGAPILLWLIVESDSARLDFDSKAFQSILARVDLLRLPLRKFAKAPQR